MLDHFAEVLSEWKQNRKVTIVGILQHDLSLSHYHAVYPEFLEVRKFISMNPNFVNNSK